MTKQNVNVVFNGTPADLDLHILIAELVINIDHSPFPYDRRPDGSPRSHHLQNLLIADYPFTEDMLTAALLEVKAYIVHCQASRNTDLQWQNNTFKWAIWHGRKAILKKHLALATDVEGVLKDILKQLRFEQKKVKQFGFSGNVK